MSVFNCPPWFLTDISFKPLVMYHRMGSECVTDRISASQYHKHIVTVR